MFFLLLCLSFSSVYCAFSKAVPARLTDAHMLHAMQPNTNEHYTQANQGETLFVLMSDYTKA